MHRKMMFFFMVFLITSGKSFAGEIDSLFFRNAEDTLVLMANQIVSSTGDAARLEQNRQFYDHFRHILSQKGSFDHPFDSLRTVSMLYAPDKRFRLITWYVPLSGQRFHYCGLIQRGVCDEISEPLTELTDPQITGYQERDTVLDKDHWFGAYYYDIIHHRVEGTDLYTLLGWKGDNQLTRMRVIEPLVFDQGRPLFGKPVFTGPWKGKHRVVFEYSARVSMSLLYEENVYQDGNTRSAMIVFDRLEPLSEHLGGQFQFYKPEVNIFDGLYFDNGRWSFVSDVDVRMPGKGN